MHRRDVGPDPDCASAKHERAGAAAACGSFQVALLSQDAFVLGRLALYREDLTVLHLLLAEHRGLSAPLAFGLQIVQSLLHSQAVAVVPCLLRRQRLIGRQRFGARAIRRAGGGHEALGSRLKLRAPLEVLRFELFELRRGARPHGHDLALHPLALAQVLELEIRLRRAKLAALLS